MLWSEGYFHYRMSLLVSRQSLKFYAKLVSHLLVEWSVHLLWLEALAQSANSTGESSFACGRVGLFTLELECCL